MTFKKWILQFTGEDTPRGDLAGDIKRDEKYPSSDQWGHNYAYLAKKSACRDAIRTLHETWTEYRADVGTYTLFFEIYNQDSMDSVFSEFVKEKEVYQFLMELNRLFIDYDITASEEPAIVSEDHAALFQIELPYEQTEKDFYMTLNEIKNEFWNKTKHFRVINREVGKIQFLAIK